MIPIDTDWDGGRNEAIAPLRRLQPRVRLARCDQAVVCVDVFDILGVGDLVWNCNQEFTWSGAVELLLIFFDILCVDLFWNHNQEFAWLGAIKLWLWLWLLFHILGVVDLWSLLWCLWLKPWKRSNWCPAAFTLFLSKKVDSKLLLSGEARWTRNNGRCQQKGRGNKYCNFKSNDIGQK